MYVTWIILNLYEVGGDCEKYTLNSISDLEKLYFKDKMNEVHFELNQLKQKISEIEEKITYLLNGKLPKNITKLSK
jgi:hypothetical protein